MATTKEAQALHSYNQNILKGAELENPVHCIYKQEGFDVQDHKVTESGVDSKAFRNGKIRVAECLHWYGGYIHLSRWLSITDNLLAYPSADRDLICVGVHPTEEQYQDAHNLNINIIYGDTVAEATTRLKNLISGVMTQQHLSGCEERVDEFLPSYPFSSYAQLEFDHWDSIASDLLV